MNAFEASVTARKFKPLKPFHVFFKFPIHVVVLPSQDESYTSYWLSVHVAINDRSRLNKDE